MLASGRGSNAEAILESIRSGRLPMEPALLVCDRPGAGVIEVAQRFGVPFSLLPRADFPSRLAQQSAIRDALLGYGVEVVALAGFGAVLLPIVVQPFAGRILNIHPSLLPAFAGLVAPEPQAAALRRGVTLAGCTVHLVTEEVDGGPILAQAAVPVLPDDSVETLAARILVEEHRLYPQVLGWFAEGRVRIVDGRLHLEDSGAGLVDHGTRFVGSGTRLRSSATRLEGDVRP
jgi:phosphoribosylglycinamide formyltransferase-1